jgi:hypothetical protein
MTSHSLPAMLIGLAWGVLPMGAFAQTTPATPPASSSDTGPKAADTDENFMLGLRRVGVMIGQVVECSSDTDRPVQIAKVMDLANKIAINFGLKSAFTFVGSVGYGSGHPFEKTECEQANNGWKDIQAKYLNK